MSISASVALSAFFLSLSPALYAMSQLASDWLKLKRLGLEAQIELLRKQLHGVEQEALRRDTDRCIAHDDLKEEFRRLNEKHIALNNRVATTRGRGAS